MPEEQLSVLDLAFCNMNGQCSQKRNKYNLPGGVVGCVVGVVRTGGTEGTVNMNMIFN